MTAKIFRVDASESSLVSKQTSEYVEQVKRDMAARRRHEYHRKLHERLVAEKGKE